MAFLFFVGSLIGWGLEFLFRNLISHKGPKGKYFINPGFCVGPYLPIYGVGLAVMFVISYCLSAEKTLGKTAIILLIAVIMTIIEFVGGLFLLKVLNMRLWDYRKQPGNIMGLICPLFSLIWGAIGAVYFLVIHPMATEWLIWLAHNLPFAFFIGMFYGVFILDILYSFWKSKLIREYGNRNDVIIKYEELKALIAAQVREEENKSAFFRQVSSGKLLTNALERNGELAAELKKKVDKVKKEARKAKRAKKENKK